MEMLPIYTCLSESEAVVITSMMTAYDIDFLISNKHFGTMYPGVISTGLSEQILLVREDQVDIAKELLRSFIEHKDEN